MTREEKQARGIIAFFIAVVLILLGGYLLAGKKEFTIGPGEGLVYHIKDYDKSIDVAEKYGIPLYLGKRQAPENRISYDRARELKSQTDRIQVTAGLVVGDHFVVRRFGLGQFDPSPLRRQYVRK